MKFSFSAVGDMLIQHAIPTDTEAFSVLRSYISRADARFVNLETTLHHGEHFGNQFCGGSYLYADPKVLDIVKAYGFNMLSFANNHTFDYSYGGLISTLNAVRDAGILNAGVGMNLDEAAAPVYLDTPKGRIALIAAVSSMMSQAAMAGRQSRRFPGRPGVNGLRTEDAVEVTEEEFALLTSIAERSHINAERDISIAEGYSQPSPDGTLSMKGLRFVKGKETAYRSHPHPADMERIRRSIYEAQMQADQIIVSIHSHELSGTSKENPADFLCEFAHACIDAGAHAVIGHGPHLLRGMEIYRDRPIFYSLGDFVLHNEHITAAPEDMFTQYGFDSDTPLRDLFEKRSKGYTRGLLSDRRMMETVIPYFEMEDGHLVSAEFLPVELDFDKPRWDSGTPHFETRRGIIERYAALCAPYGTKITVREDGIGVLQM